MVRALHRGRPVSDDIGKKTKKGLYWNLSLKIPYELLHFALSIVVARILEPKDFGLASIAAMAVYYSNTFTNFGFNQALVQRKEITTDQINAVFTFDLIISGALTGLFWLLAGPIAAFFHAPEARDMIRVMSLLFIITTFHDLPYTLLRRNIEFKMISLVDAGRELAMSLITLALALAGFRYWSIVFGRLIAVFLTALYLLYKVDWSPRIARRLEPLKELFNFGIWTVISSQTYFFSTRIDRILVGRVLSVATLGLYDKAKSLAQIPTDSIAQNINNVLFSSFSRAQQNAEEVKKLFHKGSVIISAITFPIYVGLLAVAPHFVLALLGEKWRPMIPALQILSLSGLFTSMNGLFATLVIATGQYKSYTRRLIFMTVLLAAANLFITRFGMEVVAISVTVYSCGIALLSYHIIHANYAITWKEIVMRMLPASVCSVIMFAAVRAAATLFFVKPTVLNLILQVATGALVYAAAMLLIPSAPLRDLRVSLYRDASKVWSGLTTRFGG